VFVSPVLRPNTTTFPTPPPPEDTTTLLHSQRGDVLPGGNSRFSRFVDVALRGITDHAFRRTRGRGEHGTRVVARLERVRGAGFV
jgi:hypothetical protein